MNKTVRLLVSCYFWFEFMLISAILVPFAFVIFLITFLFDKKLVILHKYTCIWSFIVLKLNFMWRIKVIGRKNISSKETYVMVSNHQSGADIIVLFLLWKNYKWVAKKSLYYFPFIGWNMWLNRYIPVERGKPSSMRKMMSDAATMLRSGISLMIFPEGTRSKDGRLQAFKTGAFHLALETGKSIVPIVIKGTSMAIRKGGFLINRNHDIQAKVLPPIPYESIKGMDVKEVTLMVHNIMMKESDDRPVI
ncbi:MAG: lysophospholipid acyltransferase family protein [Bacteroidetes bacterium]|nr:lysophospholipid acyltransferase family protein [Bacteroidota bacterium]